MKMYFSSRPGQTVFLLKTVADSIKIYNLGLRSGGHVLTLSCSKIHEELKYQTVRKLNT